MVVCTIECGGVSVRGKMSAHDWVDNVRDLGKVGVELLAAAGIPVPLATVVDRLAARYKQQVALNRDPAREEDAASLARSLFRPQIDPARLSDASTATLLRAERGIVTFSRREQELQDFRTWIVDEAASKLILVTGPSGRGKTRLLQQVVHDSRVEHRDRVLAGFVDQETLRNTPEVLAGVFAHQGTVLLVVDYAERARLETEAILKLMVTLDSAALMGAPIRVRVVLIARHKSEVWRQIGLTDDRIRGVLGPGGEKLEEWKLGPLVTTPEGRRDEFERAFRAFDQALSKDDAPGGVVAH
jgi:hypothetical protein